jgi:hypothetical protein
VNAWVSGYARQIDDGAYPGSGYAAMIEQFRKPSPA